VREHWRFWRWAVAAAVVALSIGIGAPLYNSGRIYHCRSHVDLGASTTAEECLARGGEIYPTGGNVWGVVVALLGLVVLSWLVPLVVGRRVNPRPPRPAQLWPNEKMWWSNGAWRTRGRGYYWEHEPRLREWRRRDKIPLMGDTREATRALTQHELLRTQKRLLEGQNRLSAGLPQLPHEEVPLVIGETEPPEQKQHASRVVAAPRTMGSFVETRKKIDIDLEDADLLLSYCEPGSTLEEPVITEENYRLFLNAQADAERKRRLKGRVERE
jgi:hypothetical protein